MAQFAEVIVATIGQNVWPLSVVPLLVFALLPRKISRAAYRLR